MLRITLGLRGPCGVLGVEPGSATCQARVLPPVLSLKPPGHYLNFHTCLFSAFCIRSCCIGSWNPGMKRSKTVPCQPFFSWESGFTERSLVASYNKPLLTFSVLSARVLSSLCSSLTQRSISGLKMSFYPFTCMSRLNLECNRKDYFRVCATIGIRRRILLN